MTTKKLILTPIASAVLTALIIFGCNSGSSTSTGGTTDGGTAPTVTSVSGVATNGPLIGVTMTLTCSDGTTKLTTIAGTDAKPGEFTFSSVPTSCGIPYLIEATGKGFMKPLDGSPKVRYDPLVNAPVRTITFDKTDVNVTPVTSVVAQQALDAAGSTATVGAALSRLPSDAALDSFRTNLANSLPDRVTGTPPVGAAAIKAVVNSSPAQKPEVAKLSSVISEVVSTAVAGDPSKKPSDIMSLLITDISAKFQNVVINTNISNANNITSVSGVSLIAINSRSDAIGNLVAAAVTDLVVTDRREVTTLKPSDVDAKLQVLLAGAQRNITGSTNGISHADLVSNQITSQIITQSESTLAQAVSTIRASTASTSDQDARIKAVKLAADVIQAQELDAARQAVAAATASTTKAIDIDRIVTQATVAAGIVSDKIVIDTSRTFVSTVTGQASTVNVAAVVSLAAKVAVDMTGQTSADMADATKLASIQSTVGTSGTAMATQFASFVAPSNILGRTDLDNAVISAAVISVVEKAPAGTLSTTQLANIKTTAESLASQVSVVAAVNVNNIPGTSTQSAADQTNTLVTQIDSSNALPTTSNFSSPLTVGTIPNVLVSTTTTTLPAIVPTTTVGTTTSTSATTTTSTTKPTTTTTTTATAPTTTAPTTTTTAPTTTTTTTTTDTVATVTTTTTTTLPGPYCQVTFGASAAPNALTTCVSGTTPSTCSNTLRPGGIGVSGNVGVTSATLLPPSSSCTPSGGSPGTGQAYGSLTACDPLGQPPAQGAASLTVCKLQ